MDWLGYYQRCWEDPDDTHFWSRDEYFGHDGDDDEEDEYDEDEESEEEGGEGE